MLREKMKMFVGVSPQVGKSGSPEVRKKELTSS
jgi:hypothetical protein